VFKVSSRCFLFNAYSTPAKAKASKGDDYVSIQSRSPPRKFHASKLIRQILALSLGTLLIVQVPAQVSQSGPTVSAPASESAGQVRATLSYPVLPNFETLVNEGKANVKKDKPGPVEKPSADCEHRDLVCKKLKEMKDKKAKQQSAHRQCC
jgi:hypothetical protein